MVQMTNNVVDTTFDRHAHMDELIKIIAKRLAWTNLVDGLIVGLLADGVFNKQEIYLAYKAAQILHKDR